MCITHHFLATGGTEKGRSQGFLVPKWGLWVSLQVTYLFLRDRWGADTDEDDDNGSEGTEDEGEVEAVQVL